ncbi:MAG TPA: XdhC family protein [Ideonella sp.]|uniref:XdhC family protein n=1 Tax=Ideonella sp. TaxID=1929293 RepID=UPI002E356061|nr:XdhC family protein [Ideonella sp.]HEX5684548.1 XdhC family protein [Ideonella sp.]
MDNVDLNILRQVVAWRESGHRVVMGTVTRTWGSAPRPVGSVVAVRDDGAIAGSVSGGCIEDDLIARVKAHALAATAPLDDRRAAPEIIEPPRGAGWAGPSPAGPQVVRYGVSGDEAARFGLPCGGTLELVLEPLADHSQIEPLLKLLQAGEQVRRELLLATGAVTLSEPEGADVVVLDETKLVTTHGPNWRLLIVGAGQMTHYLAQMAQALDYQVTVCDPRDEYTPAEPLPGVRYVRDMPDDAVQALKPDPHTAVIALTHDPKLDDLALMEALHSTAFYVGAIGSRVNQAKRKQRLAEHFGLDERTLAKLHGPVGIKNGARTPPEIAVSILAELTAVRYGWRIPEPVFLGDGVGPEAGCAV